MSRNNGLNVGDEPGLQSGSRIWMYHPDCMELHKQFTSGVSLAMDQSIIFLV